MSSTPWSILLIHATTELVKALSNTLESAGFEPQIFLMGANASLSDRVTQSSTPDSSVTHSAQTTQSLPSNLHNIASFENFFSSDISCKQLVAANLRYIVCFSPNCFNPDQATLQILEMLQERISNSKIFPEKPLIFAELLDELAYPLLKSYADVLFFHSSLVSVAAVLVIRDHATGKTWYNTRDLLEKGLMKFPSKSETTRIQKVLVHYTPLPWKKWLPWAIGIWLSGCALGWLLRACF